MHELSVASSIANSVIDFVCKNNVSKVLEVNLEVGELTSLAADQLKFCYGVVTNDTLIEDSSLKIIEKKAVVVCSHCSYKGAPKMWESAFHFMEVPTLQCPKCGEGAKPVEGKECTVTNIKYETD